MLEGIRKAGNMQVGSHNIGYRLTASHRTLRRTRKSYSEFLCNSVAKIDLSPFSFYLNVSGLSPKIPHRSPAKSMTAGKGKDKEVAI